LRGARIGERRNDDAPAHAAASVCHTCMIHRCIIDRGASCLLPQLGGRHPTAPSDDMVTPPINGRTYIRFWSGLVRFLPSRPAPWTLPRCPLPRTTSCCRTCGRRVSGACVTIPVLCSFGFLPNAGMRRPSRRAGRMAGVVFPLCACVCRVPARTGLLAHPARAAPQGAPLRDVCGIVARLGPHVPWRRGEGEPVHHPLRAPRRRVCLWLG
jgi:hypothetical protein